MSEEARQKQPLPPSAKDICTGTLPSLGNVFLKSKETNGCLQQDKMCSSIYLQAVYHDI